MVILGLVLIALGALAIVSGVFASEVDGTQLQYLGQDVSPMALFLVGVGAAVAIWWGLSILRVGSKRSWARRKEQKRLTELSEKLDTVDADRRMNVDHQEDKDRPTL
jgi:hypothetical protein